MNKSVTITSFFVSLMIFFSCSKGLAQEPWSSLKVSNSKIAQILYNPQHNTVQGNPNGQVTIVEFFDYNCAYCRKLQPSIAKIVQKNPDVRVVYKEYILFGESSKLATRAALASEYQGKYIQMHTALLRADNPLSQKEIMRIAQSIGLDTGKLAKDMDKPEIIQQVQKNNELIDTLGIDGAPAFVIANSKVINDPKATSQYMFVGSEDALQNLQHLIDRVRTS
jgi:protein-disulfide isomerase